MPAPARPAPLPFRRLVAALLAIPSSLLIGCSLPSLPSSTASPAAISGKVFGGQQPVSGSAVTVWAAGTGTLNAAYTTPPTLLATTTSDANGNFAFPSGAYVCPDPAAQVYLLAQGGNPGTGSGTNAAIALAAGIGNCSSAPFQVVNINEVTTVATAYALGQFFGPTLGLGPQDSFGGPSDTTALANANTYTIPTLVDLRAGLVQPNTSSITIDSARLYTVANILAACINSTAASSACSTLFSNTTVPGGITPTDTLQAAVLISLYPYRNVASLFNLIPPASPFHGLSTAPNDFTLAVTYTATNMGIAVAPNTSSTLDIDSTGRIWFPSNLPGATGAGVFDPASATFSGPFGGNLPGTPLTSPQYLAIDQNDLVWVTDQASGNVIAMQASNPSNNTSFTLPNITGGPITTNIDNTMLIAGNQAGTPILTLINSQTQTVVPQAGQFQHNPTGLAGSWTSPPFSLVFASTSNPNSSCLLEDNLFDEKGKYQTDIDAASPTNCTSGGIALTFVNADTVSVATSLNQLCSYADGCFTPSVPLNLPQGIATDGSGSLWIANSGNGSVSTLLGPGPNPGNLAADYITTSPIPYLHNLAGAANITSPYGIAIDGAGNVWLSNACTSPCSSNTFVLSELVGAAAPTITPLSAQFGGVFAGTVPLLVQGKPASSAHAIPGQRNYSRIASPMSPRPTSPTPWQ